MKIDMQQMQAQAGDAEVFLKLLANRNRLMVLCVLLEQELSVGQLNEKVPLSQSSLSQHLSALRKAGLVSTRREAQTIYYQVADLRIKTILEALYQMFCQQAG